MGIIGYSISLAVSVSKLTTDKIQIVRVIYFNFFLCRGLACVGVLHHHIESREQLLVIHFTFSSQHQQRREIIKQWLRAFVVCCPLYLFCLTHLTINFRNFSSLFGCMLCSCEWMVVYTFII